ncbi:aldehyde dehydrogenase family protein [Muricauda sp. JGD-17]|uniref:Aldehyde dehydrogenase family protein n=2 Tax=Flagellimonas ochracea TaxID=2696472 RepID=A0A964TBA6_9FLAO|nr:aldehyde dehydrogenase family protein [Allomuricauda ochracea]
MTAQEAYNQLDPKHWAKTSVSARLSLLKQIQQNLKTHANSLGETDARMKNDLIGQNAVSKAEGMGGTVMPMATTLMGITKLYESLLKGKMPQPNSIKEIDNNLFEAHVFPIHSKDKLAAGKQKGYLHIEGKPTQINPLDKPAGVIAISGAGNYSSSIEMAMALFLENKAVVHKPHQLNEATDVIWEKVFAPLIECRALAFCDADQGRALSQLDGLHSIYFTGSTEVAHAIQNVAKAPLVAECGGNNPCIIVPGKWSEKDIERQAIQIVSAGKLNGGAICGRPQTIITSKNWGQREQFLNELRKAITEETFACCSYYPGVEQTSEAFLQHQPSAEILKPENGKYNKSDCVLIPNLSEDDFAIKNEAFCQIFGEIPLDTSEDTGDFLTKATDFCNNKLLGSLGCMILVDNKTLKANEARVHQAIRELNYGGIAVNDIPPNIWLNGYLTWGGCGETTADFISGVGNFGNPLNFENVKKSVLINDFNATSFEFTNRKRVEHLVENVSYFNTDQSWGHFLKLAGQMTIDNLKGKDF